jgi:hypothetical protein
MKNISWIILDLVSTYIILSIMFYGLLRVAAVLMRW